MARRPAARAGTGDSADLTRALLARLGLPADASLRDAEDAHGRLVAFLDSAPPAIGSWARQQAAEADAALALVSGPATDLRENGSTGDHVDPMPAADMPAADEDDELDEDDVDEAEPRPARRGARPRRSAGRLTENRRRFSRIVPVLVALMVAAMVYGVYQSGGQDSAASSTDTSAAATPRPVDEAEVAALMAKLEADPADVATLRALADTYFRAGDYATAATWHQRVVEVDPKDVDARLALGVALFNTGDVAGAEKQWLEVLEIDPNQVEAHYDLGFLYLSKNPPDEAKAKAAWSKVIEIEPDSELAKTVSTHLQGLGAEPSPSAPPAGGE